MQTTTPRLTLKIRPGQISKMVALLQIGLYLPVPSGSTVESVLEAAGFSRKYLEDKVKTVFLDGSAVDNIGAERVRKGSVVALSAAMPGLAGAIFRKDSPISGLRSEFRAPTENRPIQEGEELVLLKMFNIIAEEMGPQLLRGGVIVSAGSLERFFANRRELLEKAIFEVEFDGNPIGLHTLFSTRFADLEHIFVSAFEQNPE